MNAYPYGKLVLTVLLIMHVAMSKETLRVAKDGTAAYTSIQSAIDKAEPGDIVQIEDLAVYEEQVTIDSTKNGIVLRSKNPIDSKKPVIKWQDTKNQLPKTYEQSKYIDSINYYKNGALRVLCARNVTIDGIKVDGGGAAPFAWDGVWNNKNPLFHGNAAISLSSAGNVLIRNCDISNAYFGINIYDRNEGGIFTSDDLSDGRPWIGLPISGFGKTGNHIFEDNKFHHNSWGIFFESVWDQGSIIRYNLFYENHHTSAIETMVSEMTDGDNQAGGALCFKDHLVSPLAIYNNTFWHNRTALSGHWRAGAQHLIFNNIVAQPDSYYEEFMSLDPQFANRMHHSIYAAQSQKPSNRSMDYNVGRFDPEGSYVDARIKVTAADQVRIMNGMDIVEIEGVKVTGKVPLSTGDVDTTIFADWAIRPGARITTPFGKNSTNRWFEMKFLSTDTASPDFLVPEWNDSDVVRLVLDQGWPDAGIIDADGSIADLGAIPKGGRALSNAIIQASSPVLINGTTADVTFDILGLQKKAMNNLKIKYLRWIKNVVFQMSAFGGDCDSTIIPASAIITIPAPDASLKMGTNNMKITIPARTNREPYAFLEMIIEGTNAAGKTEVSSVGFIPYRKLDYVFDVKILDYATGKRELDEVKIGDLVILSITPAKVDGTAFDSTVTACNLTLGSGFEFLNEQNDTLKVPDVKGTVVKTGYFAKAPSIGFDRISISGKYDSWAFFGASKSIKVLSDEQSRVVLQNKITAPKVQMKLKGRNLMTSFTNTGLGEPFNLELFDILGCRVANFPGNTSFTKKVNLSRLSSGSYYCRLNVNGITVKKSITLVK